MGVELSSSLKPYGRKLTQTVHAEITGQSTSKRSEKCGNRQLRFVSAKHLTTTVTTTFFSGRQSHLNIAAGSFNGTRVWCESDTPHSIPPDVQGWCTRSIW